MDPLGVGRRKECTMIAGLKMQLCLAGLIEPELEYEFHPVRKWRFDLCYPELKIAIEQEGGTRKGGRHNRHEGYQSDCRKYNEAALLGWTVLRFTTEMIAKGEALAVIERALAVRRRENEGLCDEGD